MHTRSVLKLALLAASTATSGAQAAGLDTWVGVMGGGGKYANGCTTFGSPASLSFFTFNGFGVPLGGMAACGYSGTFTQTSASVGPLQQSTSLAPVILGNPGAPYYDGTAAARANYGQLSATAHGNIAGGLPYDNLARYQSVGAARFSDTLNATSALVAAGTAGTVRYTFNVTGLLTALGPAGAYKFGETYAVLDVQQNGGPIYEVLNAHVWRGGTGTISNSAPPAGWTTITDAGSLGGSSTFYSFDLPMTWGQSWDVKVGLLAWAYGTSDTDFTSGAKLTGVTLFDAKHNVVNNFSLTATSGTDYINPVPEPASVVLMLSGLGALAWRARRGSCLGSGDKTRKSGK
jgi:hypothetical protein